MSVVVEEQSLLVVARIGQPRHQRRQQRQAKLMRFDEILDEKRAQRSVDDDAEYDHDDVDYDGVDDDDDDEEEDSVGSIGFETIFVVGDDGGEGGDESDDCGDDNDVVGGCDDDDGGGCVVLVDVEEYEKNEFYYCRKIEVDGSKMTWLLHYCYYYYYCYLFYNYCYLFLLRLLLQRLRILDF